MRRCSSSLILLLLSALTIPAQTSKNPFLGRWDFNLTKPGGDGGASWLGVSEKGGKLEIWYQPTGGNVFQVKGFDLKGSHLSLPLGTALSWELDASGNKLTGTQKRGDSSTPIAGVRAPELKRNPPSAWSTPEPLFNGKNLDGWQPIGKDTSHWVVKDGLLVNEEHGANLKTTRKFDDFKVHFEVNCPEHANSGFYLRGRYEVQLEYEPLSANPVERRMGSIYGRIAPAGNLPRTPGQWETFDVTLVGRKVTVIHNGVTTIAGREIEGITGGALDANEAEPGPFYIQGDHTGGLKFRNITVSVPKK